MIGALRVIVGLIATLGMFVAWGVLLPLAAMAIALYIVRAWPLTRRKY